MADYARATTISSLGPLSKQAKAIIDNHLRIVGSSQTCTSDPKPRFGVCGIVLRSAGGLYIEGFWHSPMRGRSFSNGKLSWLFVEINVGCSLYADGIVEIVEVV